MSVSGIFSPGTATGSNYGANQQTTVLSAALKEKGGKEAADGDPPSVEKAEAGKHGGVNKLV